LLGPAVISIMNLLKVRHNIRPIRGLNFYRAAWNADAV